MLIDSRKQLVDKLSKRSPHESDVRKILNELDDLVSVDLSLDIVVMRKLAQGYTDFSKGRTGIDCLHIEKLMV